MDDVILPELHELSLVGVVKDTFVGCTPFVKAMSSLKMIQLIKNHIMSFDIAEMCAKLEHLRHIFISQCTIQPWRIDYYRGSPFCTYVASFLPYVNNRTLKNDWYAWYFHPNEVGFQRDDIVNFLTTHADSLATLPRQRFDFEVAEVSRTYLVLNAALTITLADVFIPFWPSLEKETRSRLDTILLEVLPSHHDHAPVRWLVVVMLSDDEMDRPIRHYFFVRQLEPPLSAMQIQKNSYRVELKDFKRLRFFPEPATKYWRD